MSCSTRVSMCRVLPVSGATQRSVMWRVAARCCAMLGTIGSRRVALRCTRARDAAMGQCHGVA
eukprot:10462161-Lingulodinium_polyedra.AAC.1